MKLEPITQSEVTQEEKDKCCMLMPIYEIQKNGSNDIVCKAEKRHRRKEKTIGLV